MERPISRSQIVFFNSKARSNGQISDFDATLPVDLFNFNTNELGEIELISFTSKQSYTNIHSSRNSHFTYTENSVAGEVLVTLRDGNYSIKELSVEIQTQLNAIATDLVWIVTYDLKSLKYTFTYTGVPAGDVYFKPILESFSILGFSDTAGIKTMSNSEVSDKLVSIGNEPTLFIHSNWVGTKTRHLNGEDEAHHNHSRIFAEIPVIGTSFFGTIYWEKSSDFSYKMELPQSVNTNVIHFSLRDKEGNLVVLTEDYSMVLKINVYKKTTFSFDKLQQVLALLLVESRTK